MSIKDFLKDRWEDMRLMHREPWRTWVDGFIAGGLGRTLILGVDSGWNGPAKCVSGRALQAGFFFSWYIPLAEKYRTDQDLDTPTEMLAFRSFWIGFWCQFFMRLVTNPFTRIQDEVRRTGQSWPFATADLLRYHGHPICLWWNRHPYLTSSFHFGATMACFSVARRGLLNLGLLEPRSPLEYAIVDGIAGSLAAATASFFTFPLSQHIYMSYLPRDSILSLPVRVALAKEVPLVGFTFGAFSFIHAVRSGWTELPHNRRDDPVHGGFGYLV
jgi:hypothetical protein